MKAGCSSKVEALRVHYDGLFIIIFRGFPTESSFLGLHQIVHTGGKRNSAQRGDYLILMIKYFSLYHRRRRQWLSCVRLAHVTHISIPCGRAVSAP